MVFKSFEDYDIPFNMKSQNKTSNMDFLIITEVSSEILEMLNRGIVTRDNLFDFC